MKTIREFIPLWESRKHYGNELRCMPAPQEGFPCDHCFFQARGKGDDTCTKPGNWSGCTEFNRPDLVDVIFVKENKKPNIQLNESLISKAAGW